MLPLVEVAEGPRAPLPVAVQPALPARARILGTGTALPSRVVTNDDLSRELDTSDAWIVERTGIRARHILEPERAASDLATEAGARALAAAGLDAASLDAIIVCTVTPDSPLPSCAAHVQAKLGATCAAFDVVAACAGFVHGLAIGDSMIRAGALQRVLVVGVEVLSRIVDWRDRTTCVLFGDGAGAAVLGPSGVAGDLAPDGDPAGLRVPGVLATTLGADGKLAGILHVPAGGSAQPTSAATVAANLHTVKMNGRAVFGGAVKNLGRACEAVLARAGLAASDVDVVVAHQANLRILEGVAERIGVPLDRFVLNIDRCGNTSSASVPIALDEAVRAGRVRRGDLVLACALGAGLAWGAAVLRY